MGVGASKSDRPRPQVQKLHPRPPCHSPSPEPPATPGAGPSSPVLPTTAPPSPAPSGADPSLLRELDRLERKMDVLTELIRCLMTGEEPPFATEVTPDVNSEVPEASALAT